MPPRFAKAFAPATVANVGPGFDVFGFALEGRGDTVEATRIAEKKVRLRDITGDDGRLPRDPARNVATAVAARMLRDAAAAFGVDISLHKGLPLGSGLGSSSASAVAAAVAVNALLGSRYKKDSLLEFARHGEFVACGAAHADNVAPALFGGFTIVRGAERVEVIRLDAPRRWHAAVAHPHIGLPTRKARAALPRKVALAQATANVAGAASFVAALATADLALAGRALMADALIEPARSGLIPGYAEVRRAALAAGAVGVAISGAGPSMFALTDSRARAKVIAAAMAGAWHKRGIGVDHFVSHVGGSGAAVIERS